jgi:hypothetical protein
VNPVETESPEAMCRVCWAQWWASHWEHKDEVGREEAVREIIANIASKIGEMDK